MIEENDLAKTNISVSYTISPFKNVICDLSGIIGNFIQELLGAFYSRKISKKANTVITELTNNVLENVTVGNSEINVELKINKDTLIIKVRNYATKAQFQKVKDHIDKINSTENIKDLLKETIHNRKNNHLKGGLGLIRLVAENKFTISVNYNEKYLTIESQIALGGLA